jgi:hypothetical protein
MGIQTEGRELAPSPKSPPSDLWLVGLDFEDFFDCCASVLVQGCSDIESVLCALQRSRNC